MQEAIVTHFREQGASNIEVKDSFYRGRRAAVEPQTIVYIVTILAGAVDIARGILEVLHGTKVQGRVRSVEIGRGKLRVTGNMTIDDVRKLIESAEIG